MSFPTEVVAMKKKLKVKIFFLAKKQGTPNQQHVSNDE
jgi:hypothetical protein